MLTVDDRTERSKAAVGGRLRAALQALLRWIRHDKASASACLGLLLFVISVNYAHGDELPRVMTEAIGGFAWLYALIIEKKNFARVVYALFLIATLILVSLDVNISAQLSQARSDKLFEPT